MAMPHEIQKQIIKKRIKGKFGTQREKELKNILSELPTFTSGPYVELRKWVKELIIKTRVKKSIQHQDWMDVKKEGSAQIMVVGAPNIGKSSLLKKLSDVQIKVADYAFTTLRPIPTIIKYAGVEVQLVEIPGLIKGASEDIGGGKRLLGQIRNCDGILVMHDINRDISEIDIIMEELQKSDIVKPVIIAVNKCDTGCTEEKMKKIREQHPIIAIPISVKRGLNLDLLKQELWNLTGLMKVYTKDSEEPIAVSKFSTVRELAEKIHRDFALKCKSARVTGKSTKFPRQQVSMDHALEDSDVVEFILK